MVSRFRVGVITATHGLRGEVKVFPTTDEPQRFKMLKEIILVTNREERHLKIRSVKFFKQFVILGFEGLDRIEDVEKMRRAELYIDRKDALPLEEGEYFIPDLLGLTVVEEDGNVVGVLKDVMQTGANDVYVVQRDTSGGTVDPAKEELLIPAIPECIRNVDLEEKTMTVWLMPGLTDL